MQIVMDKDTVAIKNTQELMDYNNLELNLLCIKSNFLRHFSCFVKHLNLFPNNCYVTVNYYIE